MEDLKTYEPGLNDMINGQRERDKQFHLANLKKAGANFPLTTEILNAIDLFLIPMECIGKLGLVDKMGNPITEFKYDEIRGTFFDESNIAAVRIGNRWSVVDSKGNELLPFEYSHIFASKDSPVVTLNTKTIYNVVTKETITPKDEVDYIEGFRFGYAKCKKDGKWGIINDRGEIVLEPKYSNMLGWYDTWFKPETKVKETPEGPWSRVIHLHDFDK